MERGRVKSTTGLNLRDKPNGEKVSVLAHNEEFTILDEVRFYRVRTATGGVGYVHGNYIERMPASSLMSENAQSQPDDAALDPTPTFQSVNFSNEHFIGEAARVDADFVPSLKRVADYAKQCDVKVWVTSSTRNLNEQVRGAIVKPASKSCHHIGHAIDMNVMHEGKLYNSKKLKKSKHDRLPSAVRDFIQKIRDDIDLRWGGDFNAEDPVHIDDNFYHQNKLMYEAKLDSRVGQLNA